MDYTLWTHFSESRAHFWRTFQNHVRTFPNLVHTDILSFALCYHHYQKYAQSKDKVWFTHFGHTFQHIVHTFLLKIFQVCPKCVTRFANAPIMQPHLATTFQACCLAQDSGLNCPPYFTWIPPGTAGSDHPKKCDQAEKVLTGVTVVWPVWPVWARQPADGIRKLWTSDRLRDCPLIPQLVWAVW